MSPVAWQLQPNALTVPTGAARPPGDPPPPSILLQAKGQLCLREAPSDSQQVIPCPPTSTCQEQGLLSEKINRDALSLLKALCTSRWETQPTVNPPQSRGSENPPPRPMLPTSGAQGKKLPRGQERSGAGAPLQVGLSSRGQGHPKVPASCTEVRTPLEFQLSPTQVRAYPAPIPQRTDSPATLEVGAETLGGTQPGEHPVVCLGIESV